MATAQEASDWVEKYADGGSMCLDCQYSHPVDPGSGHFCLVAAGETRGHQPLEPTDCPALPDAMYYDVTEG